MRVGGIMYSEMNILEVYNRISENKISIEDFLVILPKIHTILTKIDLDMVEIIELVDTLLIFKNNNKLNNINEESIKLLVKIIKTEKSIIDGNLYFNLKLKFLLLPFDLNKCEKEILLFLSEFEVFLDLISKVSTNNDYNMLWKYNEELVMLMFEYKKVVNLYQDNNKYNLINSTTLSHLASLFYFNQDEYGKDSIFFYKLAKKLLENNSDLVKYYINEGIYHNFGKLILSPKEIEKEYILNKNMLDYEYNQEKEEKRKCK